MKQQIIGLLAATLCFQAVAQGDLGVVELKKSGSRLYSTQEIAPGTEIAAITAEGVYRCCYRVGNPDPQGAERIADLLHTDTTPMGYTLTPSNKKARVTAPIIGVGLPAKTVVSTASRSPEGTTFSWNGDAYQLNQCTTAEGVQLTLKRRDHAVSRYYLSLGYDVDPTCKP
ncbi:hypothetical protein ACS7SF_12510 [Ralstonia sp. 25C]|uniref:hypothetical protein n=1 Tax=Ralstonia sp. 25C TaxID=3447363 RepID=UPI003F74BBB2